MRLLLDSHVWLWWLAEPERLKGNAAEQIANADNTVFVSVLSQYEIGIKQQRGLVQTSADLAAATQAQQLVWLPVQQPHAALATELPRHHLDPFDRMLIAQARLEQLMIVTRDPAFPAYNIDLLPA